MDWERAFERVRQAAEFCTSAGLECFRVEDDELSVEVRRAGGAPAARISHGPAAQTHELAVPNGAVTQPENPAPAVLRAEFVGVVRFARPAVSEGATVHEDRELAYVESLGVRNPIRCAPGRISAIYVSDGQPVEYGQPLFAVEAL